MTGSLNSAFDMAGMIGSELKLLAESDTLSFFILSADGEKHETHHVNIGRLSGRGSQLAIKMAKAMHLRGSISSYSIREPDAAITVHGGGFQTDLGEYVGAYGPDPKEGGEHLMEYWLADVCYRFCVIGAVRWNAIANLSGNPHMKLKKAQLII